MTLMLMFLAHLLLADAAPIPPQVDNWFGLAAFALLTVSGWVTILLKQRGNATKIEAVGGQVTEVSEQVGHVRDHVANGHPTLLRNDLTEMGTNVKLIKSYLELLPTRDDFKGLVGRVSAIEKRLPPPA